MKKILLLSLLMAFAFSGFLYAAGTNGQYKGHDIVRVMYEGKELKPDDVPGQMIDGRTMVPIGLLRKAGFAVEWDARTLTANITTKTPETVAKTPLTIDQIKELGNRVALIYSLDSNGKRIAQGSGFIINSRGLLITAYHVAEEGGQLQKLEVQLNGKTYFVPAGVYVFADKQKDIFGVYLQDPDPLPFLNVSAQLPDKFDDVFVIGNPAGKRNDISDGYVTAVFSENGRQYVSGVYDAYPGASGSPLFNQFGEVIGIISGGSGNVSVSTSINDAIALYKQGF